MGLLAVIKSFFRNVVNGVNVPTLTVDPGGDNDKNAVLFGPAGDDSPPLNTDLAAAIGTQKTGNVAAVGVVDQVNPGVAVPGEKRLYARDALTGAIISFLHMKADGSIRLENNNGYIELGANGLLVINGQEFTAHTHSAGSYLDGNSSAVTGESGDVT